MVSRIENLAEEARISIRNIRRDANKALDQAEKGKEIGEDDRDSLKDDVQELTNKFEAQITDMAKRRETEVLED